MTESQFTAKLLKRLRAEIPEAVVLKHTELIRGGVPDFSVTRFNGDPYAHTVWCEVKLASSTSKMFKPLQVETVRSLGGWYLVWSLKLKRGWLFRADEIESWHEGQRYTFDELVERIVRFF